MTVTRAWIIWGLLAVLTLAAWVAAHVGYSGEWLALALMLSVFVKGHFVIADFMELKRAPRLWRALLHGWLLLICGLIIVAYQLGAS